MGTKEAVAIFACCVSLVGCGPSRQELLAQAHSECYSYGADPGTPAFSQCMMMKDQQIADSNMQRREHIQQTLRDMQRNIR